MDGSLAPPRGLLRVLACGSVDDGKSTLIGRLLHDCGQVMQDTWASLQRDSRRWGTIEHETDLALLTDGLEAERQQGITIDVAWRYFSTPRRSFILADAPGHAQYTRNMATAASTADCAVLLVDATAGIQEQTRRHAHLCALFGLRQLILAVNKMDLVGWDRQVFDRIAAEWHGIAGPLGLAEGTVLPIAARPGDNVVRPARHMPWYAGPTLLDLLEAAEGAPELAALPFRFPVQWVSRPDADFRGYAGTIAAGRIAAGDTVAVAGSDRQARIARIVTAEGDRASAAAGDAVTLVLEGQHDLARGDLLAAAAAAPAAVEGCSADLVWMDEAPLIPGRHYLLRHGTSAVPAAVVAIRHRLDLTTLRHEAAEAMALNDIGRVEMALTRPLPLDRYADCRATGGFILIDRQSRRTVAAGMVREVQQQRRDLHHQAFSIDAAARARLLGQRPLMLWFTGLSGAGKSSIAALVEAALHAEGRLTCTLDGDNLRHGLNRDLGFSAADRVENIRRVGEVAKLFVDTGVIVLCCFISPFRAERQMVRELAGDRFFEIFVDAPIAECIRRDPKGLYARARAGAIRDFTGIGSPYEPPEAPELHLHTERMSEAEAAEAVLRAVRGLVNPR